MCLHAAGRDAAAEGRAVPSRHLPRSVQVLVNWWRIHVTGNVLHPQSNAQLGVKIFCSVCCCFVRSLHRYFDDQQERGGGYRGVAQLVGGV